MFLFQDETGQGLLEYALILSLVSVAAIVVLVVLAPIIEKMYANANNKITERVD